ncbi:phosphoenolpyruvate carboxykinase (ATP) [Parasedimentitalea psychrophila]|uniref:Serine kinase n=1 Tax=Parasedimentitalea psychrophila TaxID=2997337 RepID=A0A9Y2L2X6_9RHOB|nr:hypothetical protein [Parasedimentitalea psychrophila]WIY27731.1 hypothetical protein QPJ95_23435 [Parasedimentitalea psychrophila]
MPGQWGEGTIATQLLISADGNRLAWIGGQAYLFIEAQQSVCALNSEAAAAWPRFETGVVCDGVVPLVSGLCAPSVVGDLLSVGAIEPLLTEGGVAPVASTQLVNTGAARVLVCYGDAGLHDLIAAEFAHMAQSSPQSSPLPCDAYISVQRSGDKLGVALRGSPIEWASASEVVPLLKIAITDAVLDNMDDLLLHVALLHKGERAILLVGGPGAGKSTLATALGAKGFTLAGDDLATLSPDGTVRALPFPVTLKTGSWTLLKDRQVEIAAAATHLRPDDRHVRYLAVDGETALKPRAVGWIVFLDRTEGHSPGHSPSVSPVTAPETISGLIGSAWSGETALTPEEFSALAACVDGASCVRLRYCDLSMAVDLLQRFCDGAPALREPV